MLTGTRVGRALVIAAALWAAGCSEDRLRAVEGELVVANRIDFGEVPLGDEALRAVRLRNAGTGPLRLVDAALEGDAAGEFRPGEVGPVVFQPGESRELSVRFAPRSTGARTARLVFDTDSLRSPRAVVELAGEGVFGRVDLPARRLDFGRVGVDRRLTLALTLRNDGDAPASVHVAEPDGEDGGAFAVTPHGPLWVGPGEALRVNVTFAPRRLGGHAASLAVTPCFGCAPEAVELVGEGVEAQLVVDPPNVDFGAIEPGHAVERIVRIGNVGTSPARLTAATIRYGADQGFALADWPAGGVELAGGAWHEVTVRFTPVALDDARGQLALDTFEGGEPGRLLVGLAGFGGGPEIAVSPAAVTFPVTAVGLVLERSIALRNAGHDPDGVYPLVVHDFRIDTGAPFDVIGVDVARGDTLDAGEARTLRLRYAPTTEGDARAELRIETNDADAPLVVVPLAASARAPGACTYAVVPAHVDFGALRPGRTATLAVEVRNTGPNPCALANVRLSSTTGPAFSLTTVADRWLEPGEHHSLLVHFTPPADGAFTGAVEFDASSPAAPSATIPLSGRGAPHCLELQPDTLRFGTIGLQCRPPVRSTVVHNACAVPVAISGVRVGSGPTTEFTLTSGAGPRTLQPGQNVRVDVAYAPVDEGDDVAALFVSSDAAPAPLLVGLEGRGEVRPTRTDVFADERERVDFLFVIDNSASMAEEQEAISRHFDELIRAADARGIDYHLGVTTTGLTPFRGAWALCPGGADGGEAGRLFPVDRSTPRILKRTTPNVREAFATNVKVGVCHWREDGLEAARLALSSPLVDGDNAGFLRDDARLYVLFVSDEEDSGSVAPSTYVQFLRSLKPGRPELVRASGILGLPTCATALSVGTRYMEVVNAFGGLVGDLCARDWGALLAQIGDDAFAPRTNYPLTSATDGRAITVLIDGIELAAAAPDGTRRWRFDPAAGPYGAVVFERAQAPAPGATVEVTYSAACGP